MSIAPNKRTYLDFEKPLKELEIKIAELQDMGEADGFPSMEDELHKLSQKADQQLIEIYSKLSAWQKTQVARHPERPHFEDYRKALFTDWVEMSGDRLFGEDEAIIGGIGTFNSQSVMLIGHEKGRDTEGRVKHNFGMSHPEGYRKAIRLMDMAEKFGLPVITLVDTPGAYPGRGGEERGQAEAIARSTQRCLTLGVPLISIIVGEGGSGGAVALASASKVMMLEHAIYSVITPEGCASILWRDAVKAPEAAEAMKITAEALHELGIIDEIIPEPTGGAHRAPNDAIASLKSAMEMALMEFSGLDEAAIKHKRRERFYAIGRTGFEG